MDEKPDDDQEAQPVYRHPPSLPRGRATILTEEVLERCVEALRSLALVKDACAYAEIAPRRYHEWVARGYRYLEHIEAGGKIIEGEDIYMQFALAVDRARSEARIAASLSIRAAFDGGDWKAAAHYLAVSDPQHWERVSKVEMSGRGGEPIEIEISAVEKQVAESLRDRPPLVIAAEEEATTVIEVASISRARVHAHDDEPEEYLLVPSTMDLYDWPAE